MSDRKTIVILGAGRGQMPVYEICQNLGCRVIFVTPEGDYPGIGKAEVFYANVMDYKAVYEIAKEVRADAVISDQLDAGIYSCAYASEKLGLRGIGSDVSKRFTNKYEMRKCAEKAGVAVPKFASAKNEQDVINMKDILKYPLIMKPTDNASSRGVYMVDCEEELLSHFAETRDYSSEKAVILETFVKGTEYVVESYVKEKSITNLIIGHSDYFEIPNKFIPKGRVFRDTSVADTHIEKKVLEANNKLIKTYGLPFGITHGEFIYNAEEDEVYLVEIAARGGGEFISGVLIPLACGIRANEMMVKHALGLDYEVPTERIGKASAYFSYLLPEGEIINISGTEAVKQIEGVYDPMFDNIAVGMKTGPIRDKASRKGPLLVKGTTKEDCYKVREKIIKALKIDVKEPDGSIGGVIWGFDNPEK